MKLLKHMTKTRNQHVVPQMHLRHWADDNRKVWAYDTVNDTIFHTNIKNVCVRRDHHELKRDAELPYSIEEVFSDEIEGPAAEPLAKLAKKDTDKFKWKDQDSLCRYFGYQAGRTPFTHKKMNKIVFKLHREKALETLTDESKFLEFKKQWHEQHPNKHFPTRDELIEVIRSNEISWKINGNDHNLAMMMVTGQLSAESYRNQRWTLLVAGKERQFICSDNPIVTITGISPSGSRTETIIPISPQACLLLDKGGVFDGVNLLHIHPKMVREVNVRIATHVDRTLISANKQLLDNIIRINKTNQDAISEIIESTPGEILEHTLFRSISRTIFN